MLSAAKHPGSETLRCAQGDMYNAKTLKTVCAMLVCELSRTPAQRKESDPM